MCMPEPHQCPLCGRSMYPLEIDGGPWVAKPGDKGDFYSTYYAKAPLPVYFNKQNVTLYACECCGMVKMFKEEQYGCR